MDTRNAKHEFQMVTVPRMNGSGFHQTIPKSEEYPEIVRTRTVHTGFRISNISVLHRLDGHVRENRNVEDQNGYRTQ